MKAISLWQPWASAMALGFKRNETRGWATKYRGPLVIHAAKKAEHWPNMEVQVFFDDIAFQPIDLPRGCLLCIVKLIDCQEIFIHNRPTKQEVAFGDYTPGRFMWITEPIHVFETPIPFKGKQGLFDVPDEILLHMEKQPEASEPLQTSFAGFGQGPGQ